MMASLFYARIQSKYIQHYAQREKIIFENPKPLMFFENWKDKSIKTTNKKNDHESYYSNFDDIIVEPLGKLELKRKYDINKLIGKYICRNKKHKSFTF